MVGKETGRVATRQMEALHQKDYPSASHWRLRISAIAKYSTYVRKASSVLVTGLQGLFSQPLTPG